MSLQLCADDEVCVRIEEIKDLEVEPLSSDEGTKAGIIVLKNLTTASNYILVDNFLLLVCLAS